MKKHQLKYGVVSLAVASAITAGAVPMANAAGVTPQNFPGATQVIDALWLNIDDLYSQMYQQVLGLRYHNHDGSLKGGAQLDGNIALKDGSVGDDKLSANVPLLDADNIFAGTNTFESVIANGVIDGSANGLVGDLTGNADTATALAANPSDCAANAFATAIDAQGNLTCASIAAADLPSNVLLKDAASNTLSGSLTVNGDLTAGGVLNLGRTTLTVAPNYILGTPVSVTLTPSKSFVVVDCQDMDGCNITMGESSASEGDTLVILNSSSSSGLAIVDSSSVSQLAGAWNGGSNDTLMLIYSDNRWVELSRSNN